MYADNMFHEYFYKRFSEINEEQRELIRQIRTSSGLIILCEKVMILDREKMILQRVYDDLKHII